MACERANRSPPYPGSSTVFAYCSAAQSLDTTTRPWTEFLWSAVVRRQRVTCTLMGDRAPLGTQRPGIHV
jgi:hypothetical protein